VATEAGESTVAGYATRRGPRLCLEVI